MSSATEDNKSVPEVPAAVFVNVIPDVESLPAWSYMQDGIAGLHEWDPTGDLQQYRTANDRGTDAELPGSDETMYNLMSISSSGGLVLCCESPDERILVGRVFPGNLGFHTTRRVSSEGEERIHVLACVHLNHSTGLTPEYAPDLHETASKLIKSNRKGTFAPVEDDAEREVAYKLISRLLCNRKKRMPGENWR